MFLIHLSNPSENSSDWKEICLWTTTIVLPNSHYLLRAHGEEWFVEFTECVRLRQGAFKEVIINVLYIAVRSLPRETSRILDARSAVCQKVVWYINILACLPRNSYANARCCAALNAPRSNPVPTQEAWRYRSIPHQQNRMSRSEPRWNRLGIYRSLASNYHCLQLAD